MFSRCIYVVSDQGCTLSPLRLSLSYLLLVKRAARLFLRYVSVSSTVSPLQNPFWTILLLARAYLSLDLAPPALARDAIDPLLTVLPTLPYLRLCRLLPMLSE